LCRYNPAHLKYIQDEETQTYVDLNAPDLEKFPDFLKAIPIEFVLEEGETVFIPRKWWGGASWIQQLTHSWGLYTHSSPFSLNT
jgi:hypothetical protein